MLYFRALWTKKPGNSISPVFKVNVMIVRAKEIITLFTEWECWKRSNAAIVLTFLFCSGDVKSHCDCFFAILSRFLKFITFPHRDSKLQFRGLYAYYPDTDEVFKIYGTGPRQVSLIYPIGLTLTWSYLWRWPTPWSSDITSITRAAKNSLRFGLWCWKSITVWYSLRYIPSIWQSRLTRSLYITGIN